MKIYILYSIFTVRLENGNILGLTFNKLGEGISDCCSLLIRGNNIYVYYWFTGAVKIESDPGRFKQWSWCLV